jgi:putative ABC transport system substrate-binding protein
MLSGMRNDRPHALSVVAIGWINSYRERIIALAAKHKLPAIYSAEHFVPIGGLIGYATDTTHQFGEAATYVAKILAGARPADLPVQQPTKFELAVNLKTAKALGLTMPQTIMVRADRVIE